MTAAAGRLQRGTHLSQACFRRNLLIFEGRDAFIKRPKIRDCCLARRDDLPRRLRGQCVLQPLNLGRGGVDRARVVCQCALGRGDALSERRIRAFRVV